MALQALDVTDRLLSPGKIPPELMKSGPVLILVKTTLCALKIRKAVCRSRIGRSYVGMETRGY